MWDVRAVKARRDVRGRKAIKPMMHRVVHSSLAKNTRIVNIGENDLKALVMV
jgi:hypothetical protein